MINTDVGGQKPFNSDYEINFNLLDKNTWSGESSSAKDISMDTHRRIT